MATNDRTGEGISGEEIVLSRRGMLKAGIAAGAGILVAGKLGLRSAQAQIPAVCSNYPPNSTPFNLTPFKDLLTILPKLPPTGRVQGSDVYQMSADQFPHSFHSDFQDVYGKAPTPVWGFNGSMPGPTIEVQRDRKVFVTVSNNLQSFLACPDPKVHGAEALVEPHLVVHNHGMLDRSDSDGFPEDRFPPGVSYTYEYPNIQPGGTFWYHDHSLGVTRLGMVSGLSGFYWIREPWEKARLPSGEFELPINIQDRSFNDDATLWIASPWAPEFFGDYVAVNGTIWPRLPVKRGKYRLRILNASNARFYNLYTNPPPPPGAFLQIGTDGGFLPAPVDIARMTKFDDPAGVGPGLTLAPAERADVIIDFDAYVRAYGAGVQVVVTDNAPAPFPGNPPPPLNPPMPVMRFDVGNARGWTFAIPRVLGSIASPGDPVVTRYNTLVDWGDPSFRALPGAGSPPPGYPYPTLLVNNLMWAVPPTETPQASTTEDWYLINVAPDTHPMHVHQTQFQVLGRRPFDRAAFIKQFGPTGPFTPAQIQAGGGIPYTAPDWTPPDPNEAGYKDTVRANPNEVTWIRIPFGPFRGRFVWHCHIVDHEDNEMMRPMLIT